MLAVPRPEGQSALVATVGTNRVDVETAILLAGEGNQVLFGIPGRSGGVFAIAGQSAGRTAVDIDDEDMGIATGVGSVIQGGTSA